MARILVIEDNAVNLELMLYLLRSFGHEATGVADSQVGLDEASRGDYDLVLADLLMPGMDGYELSRRIKAEVPHIRAPLIAVTAQAMVGDRRRALAAGFDGYIAKPIDPQRFVTQIDSFLPESLRSEAALPVHLVAPAGRRSSENRPLILVIDDMQVNFEVVRAALEPLGYRVADAQYPGQAADMARTMNPALILCDVHMPGFDGFEVFEQISGDPQLAAIPFIFLSSTSKSELDEVRALSLGARRFVSRPIEPDALAAIVAEQLGTGVGHHSRRR